MPVKRLRVPLTRADPISSDQEPSDNSEVDIKRQKRKRRPNSCIPCRASKSKCDGELPCSKCRKEKRKIRPCEYSQPGIRPASKRQCTELFKSASGSFGLMASGRAPEQEQRDHFMLQIPAHTRNIASSSKEPELDMHKVLSLRRVVEEFISVKPIKVKDGKQVAQIQRQWSRFMRTSMLDAPTTKIAQALLPTNDGDLRNTCDSMWGLSTKRTVQEKIVIWQAQLDAIMHLVNSGKLMQAWGFVTRIMREIEFCDVEHESVLRTSKALSESMTLICLKLIDLEFALSFFVGVNQLTSWTQNRYLSSRVEQQKMHDHSFAVKISLYGEIHKILGTDVSQREGVWQFLHIVSELDPPSPPTELIKVSLSTKDDGTAGMQELLLVSHLCLMVTSCRTAIISGHCAEKKLPALNAGSLGIVQRLGLCSYKKRCAYSRNVTVHACAVLQAFEELCKNDPEETARSWVRLCGALIAAIVVAVAELRRLKKDDTTNKDQLERVKACFEAMRALNEWSPISEKALEILQLAEPDITNQSGAEDAEVAKSLPNERKEGNTVPPSPTADIEVNNRETSRQKKRIKVAKPKALEYDVIVPFNGQDDSHVDSERMSNGNGHVVLEQPSAPYSRDRSDIGMEVSFSSTASTMVDHSQFNSSYDDKHRHYLHPSEPSHPPKGIYVHPPSLPPVDDWNWCLDIACPCQSYIQPLISNMSSSVEQVYSFSQFGMTDQVYTQMLPTTSFGSDITMVVDYTAQMEPPFTLDENSIYRTRSGDVMSIKAGALSLGTSGIPSEISLQSSSDGGVIIDPTIIGYGLQNSNQDNANEVQDGPQQISGLFPYDNRTTWASSTLAEQGYLSHGFEHQFDRLQNPEMATPATNQYARLPGSWG